MQSLLFVAVFLSALGGVLPVAVLAPLRASGVALRPFDDWALDSAATLTTGFVVERRLLTQVHMGSKHPWQLTFEFTVGDGGALRAVGYAYDDSLGAKNTGDQLDVEYSPSRPALARPVGGYVSAMPPWVCLLILVAIGWEVPVGLVLLGVVAARVRSLRRLLTWGVGAEAEVIRVSPVWYVHFGTKHPYDVLYRFHDHSGREVVGKDRTYCYDWAAALRAGDRVGVVYNPYRPQESAIWLQSAWVARER